ncbi:ras gtpase-activating protein [Anaeramoeba ignava]|uniref:Ras gtpase-activating protein n=1 Tax=Anaeramoeba ignava TaxID=1746090 RepID=A0A9Q0LAK7_ANAIG|nr:ras gtpase-activating protein [Anaeramoeba ignava]
MNEVPQLYIQIIRVHVQEPTLVYPNVFVTVKFQRHKLKTTPKQTLEPKWNESFLFFVKNNNSVIILKLWNRLNSKKEIRLGKVNIPLNSLTNEEPVEKSFDFLPLKKKNKDTPIGRIYVKLHYTYSKVRLYDTQREIQWRKSLPELIDLICGNNFEILNALTDVIQSGDIDKLTETLITILYPFGKAVSFIKNAIEREIANTSSPHQLFRTNSISTKAMSTLCMIICKDYLSKTLKIPIQEVLKIDKIFELDPVLIKPNDSIDENFRLIKTYISRFISSIVSSKKNMPLEIIDIASFLRQSVRKKFPENEMISVAGFIFLRLLSPAIINPQAYEVINDPPNQISRKNLIWIAKIIQIIANRTGFSVKDFLLLPLQEFHDLKLPLIEEFQKQVSLPLQKEYKPTLEKDPETILFSDIVNLINFLNQNLYKIETVLSPPETEDPNKTGEKGSSLFSFLSETDKVTQFAIVLNEFGIPPERAFHKFHTISNEVIQKRKAMKITEAKPGRLSSEETKDEELIGLLNNESVFSSEPRDPETVSEILAETLRELFYNTMSTKTELVINSKPNTNVVSKKSNANSGKGLFVYPFWNWIDLQKNSKYLEFTQVGIGELKLIDPQKIPNINRLGFWLNIYNILFVHSCVENQGPPQSAYQLKRFMSENKYKIGNCVYSLDDIFQGVLHGNHKNFSTNRYFKKKTDPLTGPAFYVFHRDSTEKELFRSAQFLIENYGQIKDTTQDPSVSLPTFFKYHRSDFGKKEEELIDFILSVLEITESSLYLKLKNLTHSLLNYEIKYKDIVFIQGKTELFDEKNQKLFQKIPLVHTQKLSQLIFSEKENIGNQNKNNNGNQNKNNNGNQNNNNNNGNQNESLQNENLIEK